MIYLLLLEDLIKDLGVADVMDDITMHPTSLCTRPLLSIADGTKRWWSRVRMLTGTRYAVVDLTTRCAEKTEHAMQ
jgi:hypothetical protein